MGHYQADQYRHKGNPRRKKKKNKGRKWPATATGHVSPYPKCSANSSNTRLRDHTKTITIKLQRARESWRAEITHCVYRILNKTKSQLVISNGKQKEAGSHDKVLGEKDLQTKNALSDKTTFQKLRPLR